MAGVTNAPFRAMCRPYGPGLVYVNEMVMATPSCIGNAKTERMITFGADERPRSLQLYGSDPEIWVGRSHRLCDAGRVDHIDINFGCPAAKVTRRGGGAAVPAKPDLLRAILRPRWPAASPYGVPVTAKFRMGLCDDLADPRPHRRDLRRGRASRDRAARPDRRAALRGRGPLGRHRRAEAGRRRRSRCSATATSGRPPTRSR